MPKNHITLSIIQCIFFLYLQGCSASKQVQAADLPQRVEANQAAPPPLPPRPSGPRVLEPPVYFSEIINAAAALDEQGQSESSENCLLRKPLHPGWPWIFEADVALSVRPMPEVPTELDERLNRSTGTVLVLTRWKQIGALSSDISIAGITGALPSPESEAYVLFITDSGLYVRATDTVMTVHQRGVLSGTALEELLSSAENHLVFVTAEAGIPIEQIERLFSLIPSNLPISLALVLDEHIVVPPQPQQPRDDSTGWCPEGLPHIPEGSQRGELESTLIRSALAPLGDAVRLCMSQNYGTQSAGGLINIMIRIGLEGEVTHSCFQNDEVGGTALRRCILQALGSLTFPRPRPEGYVDVSLPLRLQPIYQHALCLK